MRGVWAVLVALLVVPALGGCLSFIKDKEPTPKATDPADVGFDPTSIRVTDTKRTAGMVTSFDGTELAAIIYEPVTSDMLPGNVTPTWGTVVFVHGWGGFKEEYEGASGAASGMGAPIPDQVASGASGAPYGINRLETYARSGLIAVAYDARGFGQSGGMATVAGPAEMKDLDAIFDFATETADTNGKFGVVGISYGGGHAFNALVGNPRVTTAVPMYGWVDLYQGLAPGNVPKLEWAAALGGGGAAGSHGRMDPIIAEWYQKAVSRTDLDTVQAQMAIRSSLDRLPGTTKPLFLCQGLQETLFPQADVAWEAAGGFTRALIFTGGHGADDPVCWEKSLTWFRHFLGGFDGDVADWPALSSVGVEGGRSLDFLTFPEATEARYFPRDDRLTLEHSPQAGNTSYTVEQRLLANPFNEPSGAWDQLGQPTQGIPEQFRQDPTALFFETQFSEAKVLLGAAELTLVASGEAATPFQLTGILFKVDAAGRSQIISRGAYAASDLGDVDNGTVTLRFHWTKADFAPNDSLVLRVGANDESWFMPYPANYSFTFTGDSSLMVPFFEG